MVDLDRTRVEEARRGLLSRTRFRMMLLTQLPMGFLSGMRVTELTDTACSVTVPFKWLNKNPFRSTFWAVLGMAAEMSTGAMVLMFTHKLQPSIAMLITETTGQFIKKATGRTTFRCEAGEEVAAAVRRAMSGTEPVKVVCPTRGIDEEGNVVAEFTFTWSLKAREAE
jgi:acyl-coenzyme A thioesterase PaaI-like protein